MMMIQFFEDSEGRLMKRWWFSQYLASLISVKLNLINLTPTLLPFYALDLQDPLSFAVFKTFYYKKFHKASHFIDFL